MAQGPRFQLSQLLQEVNAGADAEARLLELAMARRWLGRELQEG